MIAAIVAFCVIVLGAWVRLSHAGLGCPDWPGCYGQLTVPASAEEVVDKGYLEQRALEPEPVSVPEIRWRYSISTVIATWSVFSPFP